MDQFIGQILLVGFNFAPIGWAFCDGSILSIQQNTALFSLLGTTYGGNGTTNFALPDLRGRVAVGQGNGPGLPPVPLGEIGGTVNVTLNQAQLPQHTHLVAPPASNAAGTSSSPANAFPAVDAATLTGGNRGESVTVNSYASASVAGVTAASYQTGVAGTSQPVNIQQPFVGMNYIIALTGIFPSRN